VSQTQQRYKGFIQQGNPNANGLAQWHQAQTANVNPLDLGGSAAVAVGACDPSFWGNQVPFDYQVFDI
jgi:hypothetical protein